MLALVALIAAGLGVDARLAQELTIHENPQLDPLAIGRTGDLGLLQLNPKYLDEFEEKYWRDLRWEVLAVLGKFEKFDWRNPRHNAFVGIALLRDLIMDERLNTWQALIAYNCGRYRTLAGDPPKESIAHASRIFVRWYESKGMVLQ